MYFDNPAGTTINPKMLQASIHATGRVGRSARSASFKEDQLADRPQNSRIRAAESKKDEEKTSFSKLIPK